MTALRSGDTFAGYRILRLLGAGGMGEVYLAQHPRLPRRDAVKVLPAQLSANEEFRRRFEREADLASTLWHPHIVGVHDRGESGGQLWLSMDFVDGLDAAKLLTRDHPTGMPAGQVIDIISAVAGALDYAHDHGLLHRDVKPANIMLSGHESASDQQRILLADFGIARSIDDAGGLTATNMTVGTVAYAAPEQLLGREIDGRADQYALAATAYHLFTGSQIFANSNPAVVISQHLSAAPPALADRRPELSGCDAVLAVALAKTPEQRFARCADFAAALAERVAAPISATAPTRAAAIAPAAPPPETPAHNRWRRGRLLAAAVAAAAFTATVGGIAAWRPPVPATPPPAAAAASTAAAPPPAPVNTGPLTGVYTVDFGPEFQLGDHQTLNAAPARGTFEIRSACPPAGCIAVATATVGPLLQRQLILDEVDGRWIAVGAVSAAPETVSVGLRAGCEQGLSPQMWESVELRPQPDGSFTGQYRVINANNCDTARTITLTRTGDVDAARLADPERLPPLTPSPAAGFHGRYRYTYSTDGGFSYDDEGDVTTDCLRTGDRCMSFFSATGSAQPFVFADGRWTLHYAGVPVYCDGGGVRGYVERTAVLDLPAGGADPFPVVGGHGQEQATGACTMALSNYYLRFERIGG